VSQKINLNELNQVDVIHNTKALNDMIIPIKFFFTTALLLAQLSLAACENQDNNQD